MSGFGSLSRSEQRDLRLLFDVDISGQPSLDQEEAILARFVEQEKSTRAHAHNAIFLWEVGLDVWQEASSAAMEGTNRLVEQDLRARSALFFYAAAKKSRSPECGSHDDQHRRLRDLVASRVLLRSACCGLVHSSWESWQARLLALQLSTTAADRPDPSLPADDELPADLEQWLYQAGGRGARSEGESLRLLKSTAFTNLSDEAFFSALEALREEQERIDISKSFSRWDLASRRQKRLRTLATLAKKVNIKQTKKPEAPQSGSAVVRPPDKPTAWQTFGQFLQEKDDVGRLFPTEKDGFPHAWLGTWQEFRRDAKYFKFNSGKILENRIRQLKSDCRQAIEKKKGREWLVNGIQGQLKDSDLTAEQWDHIWNEFSEIYWKESTCARVGGTKGGSFWGVC